MPAIYLIVMCIAAYLAAYFVYARYIQNRILRLDGARRTPAHTKRDGIDYVPAHKMVLFGHHFASIAGLGPIVGPAGNFSTLSPPQIWVLTITMLLGRLELLTVYVLFLPRFWRW